MLKVLILITIITIQGLCEDDISHPHAFDSMAKNLRSFNFPDG
jgi:hypothetical protein